MPEINPKICAKLCVEYRIKPFDSLDYAAHWAYIVVMNNELTRYEITARHPDGRAYLIGYTPRLSRAGLIDAMQSVGDQIIDILPIGETDEINFGKSFTRWTATTSGWNIGFTGRTQRDAENTDSELPFIAA